MSQKINAKNLQYNRELPPFLARLRGENASETDPDGPDPILAARRRPVKPRSASAEAEDAPLVVDEQGNAVEVTIGADGSVKEKETTSGAAEDDKAQGDAPADRDGAAASGEKLAGIGEQRKRKIGKVIGAGAGADDEETEGKDKTGRTEQNGNKGKTTASQDASQTNEPAAVTKAKPKKKAKKIKLSFGDDDG